MRRVGIHVFLAPLVAACALACGLVAGIEDITVVGVQDLEGGIPIPGEEGGKPRRDGSIEPQPDAQVDAPGPDAKGTRCNPLTPFGAPVAIAALNSANDDATPRFSPDELTVYLASTRPGHLGGGSIYTAKRPSLAGTFGTPTIMPAINTNNGVVYHPAITGDGLRIFLQVQGGGPTDIFVATRASVAVDFATPTPLGIVNSGGFEFIPFVTPDGAMLLFSSNRSGAFQLYQSSAPAGAFQAPVLVAGVGTGNGAVADTAPVLSADLLTIYFASTRTDPASAAYDLYVARRTTPTGTFALPTLVAELNDANAGVSDVPSWISADDCRLYLTSDRLTAGGASDVYVATRAP